MRTVLILMLVGSLAAAGCAGGGGAPGRSARTKVVAAFFPLAEAARAVGGDDVEVVDLTPAGVEPHDLELTSKTLDHILDADVVLVLGAGFQPAVEKAAAKRSGPTIEVLDALGVRTRDPHVWLDPSRYSAIVTVVAEALHADRARVEAYEGELEALDARYADRLSGCRSKVLVASHEAYGWLAERYGLREESISGLVPEDEPDPAKLDELARLVAREGVTTIFTEPLLPKRAAETLAREAHVEVASLDPLESDPGISYVEAMDRNLATLTAGLGC
jgi:zinc transport system substrate-binding protein